MYVQILSHTTFLEKILIQLGLSLQEFVGSLLVEYLMNEDPEELKQQEILLLESFVETKKCFQTALSCSRLEDALVRLSRVSSPVGWDHNVQVGQFLNFGTNFGTRMS